MGASIAETPPPELPRLKPWYRLSVDEHGAVLRYGASVLEFDGAAATRLLPRLLPLLDGTHRVDEVVACLGEPIRPAIEHAVAVLHEHRLLTGPAPDGLADDAQRTAELLAATDPLDRGAAHAATRLAAARIGLLGTAPVGDTVAELLAASGVGAVARRAWEDPAADLAVADLTVADLTVAVPADDELPLLRRWNERAIATGSPWLQLLPFDGLIAAVGPLFVPGDTACHECYLLRRAANLSSIECRPGRVERGRYPTAPALDAVVAGLAVAMASRWLALDDTFVPSVVLAVEQTPEPSLSRHVLHRVPRCPACSRGRVRASLAPWHGATGQEAGSQKQGAADVTP
jgi:bacteriocin biosynthesis cyclodehydratase domain-containing protein